MLYVQTLAGTDPRYNIPLSWLYDVYKKLPVRSALSLAFPPPSSFWAL